MSPGDAGEIASALSREKNAEHLLRVLFAAAGGTRGVSLEWHGVTFQERREEMLRVLRDALDREIYQLEQADLRRRGLAL